MEEASEILPHEMEELRLELERKQALIHYYSNEKKSFLARMQHLDGFFVNSTEQQRVYSDKKILKVLQQCLDATGRCDETSWASLPEALFKLLVEVLNFTNFQSTMKQTRKLNKLKEQSVREKESAVAVAANSVENQTTRTLNRNWQTKLEEALSLEREKFEFELSKERDKFHTQLERALHDMSAQHEQQMEKAVEEAVEGTRQHVTAKLQRKQREELNILKMDIERKMQDEQQELLATQKQELQRLHKLLEVTTNQLEQFHLQPSNKRNATKHQNVELVKCSDIPPVPPPRPQPETILAALGKPQIQNTKTTAPNIATTTLKSDQHSGARGNNDVPNRNLKQMLERVCISKHAVQVSLYRSHYEPAVGASHSDGFGTIKQQMSYLEPGLGQQCSLPTEISDSQTPVSIQQIPDNQSLNMKQVFDHKTPNHCHDIVTSTGKKGLVNQVRSKVKLHLTRATRVPKQRNESNDNEDAGNSVGRKLRIASFASRMFKGRSASSRKLNSEPDGDNTTTSETQNHDSLSDELDDREVEPRIEHPADCGATEQEEPKTEHEEYNTELGTPIDPRSGRRITGVSDTFSNTSLNIPQNLIDSGESNNTSSKAHEVEEVDETGLVSIPNLHFVDEALKSGAEEDTGSDSDQHEKFPVEEFPSYGAQAIYSESSASAQTMHSGLLRDAREMQNEETVNRVAAVDSEQQTENSFDHMFEKQKESNNATDQSVREQGPSACSASETGQEETNVQLVHGDAVTDSVSEVAESETTRDSDNKEILRTESDKEDINEMAINNDDESNLDTNDDEPNIDTNELGEPYVTQADLQESKEEVESYTGQYSEPYEDVMPKTEEVPKVCSPDMVKADAQETIDNSEEPSKESIDDHGQIASAIELNSKIQLPDFGESNNACPGLVLSPNADNDETNSINFDGLKLEVTDTKESKMDDDSNLSSSKGYNDTIDSESEESSDEEKLGDSTEEDEPDQNSEEEDHKQTLIVGDIEVPIPRRLRSDSTVKAHVAAIEATVAEQQISNHATESAINYDTKSDTVDNMDTCSDDAANETQSWNYQNDNHDSSSDTSGVEELDDSSLESGSHFGDHALASLQEEDDSKVIDGTNNTTDELEICKSPTPVTTVQSNLLGKGPAAHQNIASA